LKFGLIILGCCFCLVSCSQGERQKIRIPVTTAHYFQLGANTLTLTSHQYSPARQNLLFLQLHDNEETAAQAVHQLLMERGGTLLSLENNGERNVNFKLEGRAHCFDPNRIFTPRGIQQTLSLCGTASTGAADSVAAFSRFLTELLPDSVLIVAVHNNKPGTYSIKSYQRELRDDAADIYISKEMHEDDFVLTTQPLLFKWFRQKNINVVLQNNTAVTDDGSLSVLFGKSGRPYVNIEAGFGHVQEQKRMIETLMNFPVETVFKKDQQIILE
jgi:hypothetical protein